MSILRMASFKASYALFLKLVSGAIRTIAISASAMVGDALVCFRRGTTNLLSGDVSYSKNIGFIFGISNARMSSCPCFQHFPPLPCLDNSVSGIPNAIPAGCWAAGPDAAAGGLGILAGHWEHRLKCAGNGPEVRTRCRRAKKQTFKEEANVEFQGCGPQNPRSGQGGQTHKPDGPRRQAGVRCLWDSRSQRGRRQIRKRGGQ